MAQAAKNPGRSPQLVMNDFDLVESDDVQCIAFSKHISDVFCKDYENARGKKCDSNAKIALEGNNDFLEFLEHTFALKFRTLCETNDGFCLDLKGKLLKAIDTFEAFDDIVNYVFEIIGGLFPGGDRAKINMLLALAKK